ncbi:MAG TPA: serine hydrolase domain-containing protein [Verrucomicrobiae bacterium]|nr:serine hydrolase domain-containing protein [Verrucomicrobiae bacterium]
MPRPTRREMLLTTAGFGLLAGCGAHGALTSSSLAPADAALRRSASTTATLDRYIKQYCADAPYVTAAIYDNANTVLRGYANGVPSTSVDTSWIFGIGSNTKVFTATMLAYECGGESPSKNLTDPVVKYLPPSVGKHGKAIKDVTLVDLATHTASFPESVSAEAENTLFFDKPPDAAQIAWWTDWTNAAPDDPCSGKTPGTCYNYSDWGFITLGFAVASSNEVAGATYTHLLSRYVTKPLGLHSTGAHLALSVEGHHKNGTVVKKPPTDLRSNAVDLLRFLEASLGKLQGVSAELQAAIHLTQEVHWDGAKFGNPHTDVGLAWQLPVRPGLPKLIWKNGEAGGFTSFMGMIPSRSLAVAILTNSDEATPTKAGIGFLDSVA